MQGRGPLRGPICEGRCPSALPTRGRSARAWPCHARHPGDFRFTTKVTKGVPGALPLDPVGGPTEKCSTFQSHPPSDALRRSPQKREGATKGRGICHFDTVKQLAFFSPEAPMEETPAAFKPWRGRGGLMVTEGWERRNFGFCKINSALFWQQIIHK